MIYTTMINVSNNKMNLRLEFNLKLNLKMNLKLNLKMNLKLENAENQQSKNVRQIQYVKILNF